MHKSIALIGNPNVGKSTLFNTLSNKNEHTGNWPGKTVGCNISKYKYNDNEYTIYDLPGVYSLNAHSKEEEVTSNFIKSNNYDVIVVVCDATILERNLNLVIEVLNITKNVIIAVNLIDEAKKKMIDIDFIKLEELLDVNVIPICARNNVGINNLLNKIENFEKKEEIKEKKLNIKKINEQSKYIASKVVTFNNENYDKRNKKIDKILTSKLYGIPIMIIGLLIIFYLTISLSNYPSNLLFNIFDKLGIYLNNIFNKLNINKTLCDLLLNGVYKTTTWVISVMLPPMCIFFPIFAILEDLGVLPRIAFNLDKIFYKCNSCGKQSLSMCMGFGCNAVGVTSTRIIDSKRERLVAILTNSLVPCNGRFPSLIAIITMFFAYNENNKLLSALILTLVILISIFMTFIISKILSKTILKGYPSTFTLELPPYRKPIFFKVIIKSIYEKIIKILSRAIIVSIPAGIIIFILSNININDISILKHFINFLDPFGKLIGLDGVILSGFILGLPANEIVIPIILMGYLNLNSMSDYNNLSELKKVFISNGWTIKTAICMIIFILFHSPCSTTLITIKKETNSYKWMLMSFIIPVIIGIILCLVTSTIFNIF